MSNVIHQYNNSPNNNNNNNNGNNSNNSNSNNSNNSSGPCGACKYLRRKCVKGCVFAPYFDAEQGTTHFAAVHKVFGASNASKLLLRIPVHRRLDAVVTLCYEALSRVRDPVYGCVSHIFTLQQQVLSMQSELALIQARLSTLQSLPSTFPTVVHTPQVILDHISSSSSSTTTTTTTATTTSAMPSLDDMLHYYSQPMTSTLASTTTELIDIYTLTNNHYDNTFMDDDDLQTLTREFVSKYLPGVKFKSEPR